MDPFVYHSVFIISLLSGVLDISTGNIALMNVLQLHHSIQLLEMLWQVHLTFYPMNDQLWTDSAPRKIVVSIVSTILWNLTATIPPPVALAPALPMLL